MRPRRRRPVPSRRARRPRVAEPRGDRAVTSRRGAPAAPAAPTAADRTRHGSSRGRASQRARARCAQPSADDIDELPKRSRVGLVAAILTVLLILGLGAAAYWQRDRIARAGQRRARPGEAGAEGLRAARSRRSPIASASRRPDGHGGRERNRATPAPAAAVAQRVVLYEEDPADPQGKRYVGSAIWRTETVTPGPGAAPDLAVRADLEIPERRITMTFSLRRNTDQALPASHTIEVTFNLPADFPFGGISNVPGILMKQAEQTRGAPLAGLAVKVTSGFFLVGLSAVEADMQRNLQLLKERSWFDIPIVYNNGRRAILALEKGTPGERAFDEAFKAWGQYPSPQQGARAPVECEAVDVRQLAHAPPRE